MGANNLALRATDSLLAAKKKVDELDLSGAWDDAWKTFTKGSGLEPIIKVLQVVGVALIIFGIGKWAWDRRRMGGTGGSGALWGSLLAGGILAGPGVVLPTLLGIVDLVANIFVGVLTNTAS